MRGFAYLGAFFVTNVQTHLSVFDQDLPLGTRIDLSEQLGFRDRLTVPRFALAYRLGERHVVSFGGYSLRREGTKALIDPDRFPILLPEGAQLKSYIETTIYRFAYTWLFHRDEKVSLGIGGGFFVGDLGAGIEIAGGGEEIADDGTLTAPLPTIGGRLGYVVTPKLQVILVGDVFFINYQQYEGVLTDLQLFAEHRTFRNVGFGAGFNYQGLSAEIDGDELFWELDTHFLGVFAGVTFHF